MPTRKKKHRLKPEKALAMERPETLQIAVVGVVFFVLAIRLFQLISEFAVNIFFSDQWDFNDATLFQHHSLWQMFAWQHGPHRQGAGAVLGWFVEPLWHWNSRTESFFVGGIVAVATLCALWLKRKLYGRFSYSDVIIPLIFLSPICYETLFVTANLAHGPLPLLLIILYCLAWTCRPLALRYGLVLAINFVTIYTGFGMLLGLLTPVLVAVNYWVNLRESPQGRLYSLAALLISMVSFGSFFIGYKAQTAVDCSTSQVQSITDYAWYMALMFAPFFGALGVGTVPTVVGAIAVCTLLVCLGWSVFALLRRTGADWTKYAVIAILSAYCLLFCTSTAYGRLCVGITFAQSSRYFMYLDLGLLGIYFFLLTISPAVVRNALVVIFGLSLLGTISSGERLRVVMAMLQNAKRGWRDCYLTLGDLGKCNQYALIYPWEPEKTHLQEKLDYLKRTRQNLFDESQ